MTTYTPEIKRYNVIKIEKDYDIRHYPSATMAIISLRKKTHEDSGNVRNCSIIFP